MFRKKKPLEIHYLPGISCFKQKIGLCCEDIRLISCKLMALSFIEFNAPPSGKIHFLFLLRIDPPYRNRKIVGKSFYGRRSDLPLSWRKQL